MKLEGPVQLVAVGPQGKKKLKEPKYYLFHKKELEKLPTLITV
jgi:hypothetical protein